MIEQLHVVAFAPLTFRWEKTNFHQSVLEMVYRKLSSIVLSVMRSYHYFFLFMFPYQPLVFCDFVNYSSFPVVIKAMRQPRRHFLFSAFINRTFNSHIPSYPSKNTIKTALCKQGTLKSIKLHPQTKLRYVFTYSNYTWPIVYVLSSFRHVWRSINKFWQATVIRKFSLVREANTL